MVLKHLFRNSLKNLLNSKIFKAKVILKYLPSKYLPTPPREKPYAGSHLVKCTLCFPNPSPLSPLLIGISGPLQDFPSPCKPQAYSSFPCLGLRLCPTQLVINYDLPYDISYLAYFCIFCLTLHNIYALSTQLDYCFMKVETLPFVSVFPTMSGIILCTS